MHVAPSGRPRRFGHPRAGTTGTTVACQRSHTHTHTLSLSLSLCLSLSLSLSLSVSVSVLHVRTYVRTRGRAEDQGRQGHVRSWRKAAATAMDLTTRAQLADRLRVAGEANGGGNGGVNGDGEKVCRSSRGSGLRLRCAKSIFLNPPRRRRLRNLTTYGSHSCSSAWGRARGNVGFFSDGRQWCPRAAPLHIVLCNHFVCVGNGLLHQVKFVPLLVQ